MKLTRTYPQPDSDKPNIGPRERAMAVYKYLMDMEPEKAIKHERFAVVVHAFEQQGRRALDLPLMPSLTEQLCSVTEVEARPLSDFKPDGL